jgi:hypothetical protein
MNKTTHFFEHDRHPPTPAMFFSLKELKSPFEKPKEN